MAYARNLDEIRALIAAHKRWDMIFGVVGVLALMVGVLTFAALFIDMALDGVPRLTGDFFTNFPSRRPAQAGILSVWVGSVLVMVVTAFFAVPLGVAGGIYLEEYAPKNWVTDIIEIMTQTEAEGRWKQIVLNPGEASLAYIGYQELMDLEKDYRKLKGDAFNGREFLQKILSYGALPIRTLKTKIAQ